MSAVPAVFCAHASRWQFLQAVLAVVVALGCSIGVAAADRGLGRPAANRDGVRRPHLEAGRCDPRSVRSARGVHQRRTRAGLSRASSRVEHGPGRQVSAAGVLSERTGQGRLRAGSGNLGQARSASAPCHLPLRSPARRHPARLRRVCPRWQPGRVDSLAEAVRGWTDAGPGARPRRGHSVRLGFAARARAGVGASRCQAGQRPADQRGDHQGHGLWHGQGAALYPPLFQEERASKGAFSSAPAG